MDRDTLRKLTEPKGVKMEENMTPTEVGWLWNWADDEEAVAPNDKQAEPYRKVKNLCGQHSDKMAAYFLGFQSLLRSRGLGNPFTTELRGSHDKY